MTIKYNSNYDGTTPFSDTCFQVALATLADNTVTIPGTATMQYQAVFSYNSTANVFVRNNTAATTPPNGTVTTQPYSEFRPHKKYVKGGDILHLLTPDAAGAYVGVSLMKLQG